MIAIFRVIIRGGGIRFGAGRSQNSASCPAGSGRGVVSGEVSGDICLDLFLVLILYPPNTRAASCTVSGRPLFTSRRAYPPSSPFDSRSSRFLPRHEYPPCSAVPGAFCLRGWRNVPRSLSTSMRQLSRTFRVPHTRPPQPGPSAMTKRARKPRRVPAWC